MKHLFILDSGGGAWVHGVRQLFPAPQHQCDPSSDLPPGKDNRFKNRPIKEKRNIMISHDLFYVRFCVSGTGHLEENVQL